MNWTQILWPAMCLAVITILLAVIVWRDNQANKREAALQLDLDTLSTERDGLAAQVKGAQTLRDEDLQAHHIRESEGTKQMARAGKVLNTRTSEGERHWIVSGDGCDMTDEEKLALGLT